MAIRTMGLLRLQSHTRTQTTDNRPAPVSSFSCRTSCHVVSAVLATRNAQRPQARAKSTNGPPRPAACLAQASPCSSRKARKAKGVTKRPVGRGALCCGCGLKHQTAWWLRRSSTSSSSAPPSPSVYNSPRRRYHPPRSLRRCAPIAMQRVPAPPSPVTLPVARPGVALGGFCMGRVGSRPRGPP